MGECANATNEFSRGEENTRVAVTSQHITVGTSTCKEDVAIYVNAETIIGLKCCTFNACVTSESIFACELNQASHSDTDFSTCTRSIRSTIEGTLTIVSDRTFKTNGVIVTRSEEYISAFHYE